MSYPIVVKRYKGNQSTKIACQVCDATRNIGATELRHDDDFPCPAGCGVMRRRSRPPGRTRTVTTTMFNLDHPPRVGQRVCLRGDRLGYVVGRLSSFVQVTPGRYRAKLRVSEATAKRLEVIKQTTGDNQ